FGSPCRYTDRENEQAEGDGSEKGIFGAEARCPDDGPCRFRARPARLHGNGAPPGAADGIGQQWNERGGELHRREKGRRWPALLHGSRDAELPVVPREDRAQLTGGETRID